jgi:hypothetical protein
MVQKNTWVIYSCGHCWRPTAYVSSGQTDGGQSFGRQRPLFGLYHNLFATPVWSKTLRVTALFGSSYLCEEAFSSMKIMKSRYQIWCLSDRASLRQLKNKKTTRCHLLILFYFLETQHVSGINMSIFRSMWLYCWTATLVVSFHSQCSSSTI